MKERYLGTAGNGFGSLGKWERDGEIRERGRGLHFVGSVMREAGVNSVPEQRWSPALLHLHLQWGQS